MLVFAFVKCYFFLFGSESGAFLLFSKKMLPKLKQRTQSAEACVNGRTAVVQQVRYTLHKVLIEFLLFIEF